LPATKSAQRQMRVDAKKHLRNKSTRSLCKTNTVKAQKLIAAGEVNPARAAVALAISSLDKAAEKGIIHPNNAARRKSRLMKKINSALPAKAKAKSKPKAA